MIVEQREVRTTVKLHASELLRSDEKSRINYSVDNPRARVHLRASIRAIAQKHPRFILVPDPENWLRPDDNRQGITYAKTRTMIDRAVEIFFFLFMPTEKGVDDIITHVSLLRRYTGENCFFLSVANVTSSFFCA